MEQTSTTHKMNKPLTAGNEVVLSISNNPISYSSPESSTISMNPEENLTRRRTITTVKSKSKSRLLEPVETHLTNQNRGDEISKSEEDEDSEDEHVYKASNTKTMEKPGKKFKAMVLMEWALFICIMGVLIGSLTIPKLKSCLLWGLEIWKWCVLVLVFFCGRLVTGWFMNLIVFLLERNFLLKRKVLYFVFALKRSVGVSIWLSLILITWTLLINRGVKRSKKTTRILNYITRGLASSLIGAGLWMVKTFLLKLLASSFHVSRFFDRIQESIFHQYVLQTLSGFPLIEYAELETVGKSDSKRKQRKAMDVEKLRKTRQDKVSAWTMRSLIQVISGSRLSTLSSALDRSIDECSDDDDSAAGQKEITSVVQAKAAAIGIFKNVAKPDSKYIEEEDLLRFMKKEDVDNLLLLFDGGNGKITKSCWKAWVVILLLLNLYLNFLMKCPAGECIQREEIPGSFFKRHEDSN